MKREYQAVIALNTRGAEDSVEKLIKTVGSEIEAEGGKLTQIDQVGRRKYAHAPKNATEGFYVNYHFQAEPNAVSKVQARLKLNHDVHYQAYSVKA